MGKECHKENRFEKKWGGEDHCSGNPPLTTRLQPNMTASWVTTDALRMVRQLLSTLRPEAAVRRQLVQHRTLQLRAVSSGHEPTLQITPAASPGRRPSELGSQAQAEATAVTATMTVTTVPMWPRDLRSDGTSSRGACYRHCRADSADGPSPTSDGTGAAWRADGHASPREP